MLWVEQSYDNFHWLRDLALALNDEYRYRFEKNIDHKSIAVLPVIEKHRYSSIGLTPFVQAMPNQYKVENDGVSAYRNFYRGEKMRFARWTRRPIPEWMGQQ